MRQNFIGKTCPRVRQAGKVLVVIGLLLLLQCCTSAPTSPGLRQLGHKLQLEICISEMLEKGSSTDTIDTTWET